MRINKSNKINKYSKPFPYIVIENFLEEESFKNLEKNFPSIQEFQSQKNKINRMHYDTSYGDKIYEDFKSRSVAFESFHKWVFSKDFSNFFLKIFEKDIENELEKSFLVENINLFEIVDFNFEDTEIINKKNIKKSDKTKILYPRLDVGTGLKNYGVNTGGKGPHIDNPQRLISILYYCGGFSSIEGGEHRIYEIDTHANDLKISKTIFPKKNTLIASMQNNIAFHDVNPISDINGQRNAFYMAISSNLKLWKNLKRDKINMLYNKNRYNFSFVDKILTKFFLSKKNA